jgi:hypothetical protein
MENLGIIGSGDGVFYLSSFNNDGLIGYSTDGGVHWVGLERDGKGFLLPYFTFAPVYANHMVYGDGTFVVGGVRNRDKPEWNLVASAQKLGGIPEFKDWKWNANYNLNGIFEPKKLGETTVGGFLGPSRQVDVMEDVGIRGMTYGEGVFMAVGTAGRAAYSTDGIDWTQIKRERVSEVFGEAYFGKWTKPDDQNYISPNYKNDLEYLKALRTTINCVGWGDGTFVMVNREGKVAYSTDKGGTWNRANGGKPLWPVPPKEPPEGDEMDKAMAWAEGEIGIAYDKRSNFFLVVTDDGMAARSPENGLDGPWKTFNIYDGSSEAPDNRIKKFAKIAWGGGNFLVGGYTKDNKGKLLYSSNGERWTVTGNGFPEQMSNGRDDENPPSSVFHRHYVIEVSMQIVYGNYTGKFLVMDYGPSGFQKMMIISDPPTEN